MVLKNHARDFNSKVFDKAGLKAGDELQAQAEKGEIRLRGK